MYWRHPASAGMLNGELYWETACMPIDHEVVEMMRVHKAELKGPGHSQARQTVWLQRGVCSSTRVRLRLTQPLSCSEGDREEKERKVP